MKKLISLFVISVSVLLAGADTGVVWLSQIPPPAREKQIRLFGMHRLPALKARGRGPATLALWLRQGDSILEADYPGQVDFDSLETIILSPQSEPVKHKLTNVSGAMELNLSGSEEGFYNAYLIGRKLSNETLQVSTIQSELINHSCRNGHDHVSRNLGPTYGENIPLEIIRTRVLWEDFHTFIKSGDNIEYQLLLFGQPAPGVEVTLSTHQGWQKSKHTGKDGKVSFEFIGEYFGKDKEFHSRDIYHYLLVANYTVSQGGSFQGNAYQQIKYQTSVSEKYRAATEIYTSTVWGLFSVLLTTILISVGIFVYRRKTTRSYKEIVFSEKD